MFVKIALLACVSFAGGDLGAVAYESYAASTLAATSESVYGAAPFSSGGSNPGVVYARAAPTTVAAAPVASHTTYSTAPLSSASPTDSGYVAIAPMNTDGMARRIGYATGHGYAAKSADPSGLLGVAYSPAVTVSRMTYSSPLGVNYSW